MKYFNKFAGVIAILCAMAASNNSFSQSGFSSCEDFKMSMTFDSLKNTVTVSAKFTDTNTHIPTDALQWQRVRVTWFGSIETDTIPPRRLFKKGDVYMSWQESKAGDKHANINAYATVKQARREGNMYIYTLQLTPEQVQVLKSFAGLPGCKGFSPGVLQKKA